MSISAGPTLAAVLALRTFNGLYGQDPYAYYDYAMDNSLIADLIHFRPLPPFFWPPGYPLLISFAALFIGPSPLAGQLVSLFMGIAAGLATALLAREVWVDHRRALCVPLIAGLLVTLTGQLWQSSVVVMSDTTGLAAATLGIWALARYGRLALRENPLPVDAHHSLVAQNSWLVLSGAALSFAVLTRWGYALVTIPAFLYYLNVIRKLPLRAAVFQTLAAGMIAGLILTPIILPFLSGLSEAAGASSPNFVGDLKVYTWNPINAFRRNFFTTDGSLSYRFPNGLYYALLPAHRFFFTPFIAVFLIPGTWSILRTRRDPLIGLLAGWAVIVYAFHAGAPWQNFRFSLAYLPPLAIIAAIGISQIHTMVVEKGTWYPGLLFGFVTIGMAAMAYGGVILTKRFIDRNRTDREIADCLRAMLPTDAQLITFGLTQTIRHNTPIETIEIFYLDPDQMAALVGDGTATFLFLDLSVIQSQWGMLAPGLNYDWFEEETTLEELGTCESYTLFKVAGGET